MKVIIKRSNKSGKKYMATFTRENGRTRTTHFGQASAPDYTLTGDKKRRKAYRDRHRKDLNTGDYMRAGYLSWYILWGESKSLRENIKSYKRRFNLN
tara:strand:- start:126 stop:416 length:291 start_codon:yes stop_codon:yes gene_type:complete